MKSIERIKRKVEKKYMVSSFPIGKKIFFNIYVRTSSVIKITKKSNGRNKSTVWRTERNIL